MAQPFRAKTMPTSGRASVSSSARHSRQSSQSTSEFQQSHRREKTKSSPSYVQGRPYNPPATQTAGADPAAHVQRPFKNRAHSAPHIPKSSSSSRNPAAAAEQESQHDEGASDNDDAGLFDDEPSDDEAIADDPFFQRFDMPTQTTSRMNEQRGTFLNHDEMSEEEEEEEDNEGPLSPTSTVTRARPDSTAEPLQSPLNPNSPTTVGLEHLRT